MSLSATNLSTETGLDCGDRPTRTAGVAGNEVETVFALVEFGVGAAAGFACNIFNWRLSATVVFKSKRDIKEHTDISSQDVLNLLLLETTLNDQTPATVDTAAGTQFGEQELHDVVVRTLHTLADVGDVREDGTTVTFTQTLRRRDLIRLGAAGQQVGMVALDEGEESGDEE